MRRLGTAGYKVSSSANDVRDIVGHFQCLFMEALCRPFIPTWPGSPPVLLIGSHDGGIYCLQRSVKIYSIVQLLYAWSDIGCVIWRTQLPSAVFSSPFAAQLLLQFSDQTQPSKAENNFEMHSVKKQGTVHSAQKGVVCICSTLGGVFLLDLTDGHICGHLQLPGEVFSSPVLFQDKVLVGCRDNNLYALHVHGRAL